MFYIGKVTKFLMWCTLLCLSWGLRAQQNTPLQYIEKYKDMAVTEMVRTGIPASITLAQGLLESGNGNSYLAREANNHFGIKCKKDWAGKVAYADDDALQECFRAYSNAEESYRDHSDFLVNGTRYAFLFELKSTDYKGWAHGLRKAGYATNPKYGDLLIGIIEKYELQKYDNAKILAQRPQKEEPKAETSAENNANQQIRTYNNLPVYIVKVGDDYLSIAKANNMMPWQVRKYNDLDKKDELLPGTILYLKPKGRNVSNTAYYTVQEGENMYYISQKFAIKLKHLYRLNRMENGQEPAAGEKLQLKKKSKTAPKLKASGNLAAMTAKTPIMVSSPATATVPVKQANKEKPVQQQKTQKTEVQKTEEKNTGPKQPLALQKPVQPVKAESNPTPVSEALANQLIESSEPLPTVTNIYHVVQPGETLYAISKKYGVTVDDLKSWNNLEISAVAPNQKLRVKQGKENSTIVEVSKTVTEKPGEVVVKDSKPSANIEEKVVENSGPIHPEEEQLQIQFTGKEPEKPVHKPVVQPAPQTKPVQQSKPQPKNVTQAAHTVEHGDTLYSIARKYQVSVSEIREWNALSNDNIRPGQKLKVSK